ncbi:MAG: aspartate carbamoyltransferase [Rhizobacter sp.]|nr:aspartate carbamoyltransferase [Rhizobacter sp.]
MLKKTLAVLACTAAAVLSAPAGAADAQRQAEVAKRGPDVMPFSLKATQHVFTRTPDGGVQKVVARNSADIEQVKLVRGHLRDIETQFLRGDFSGPAHIHGAEMPGLTDLKAAKPGQIAIDYKDVAGGAELTYRTADARLVTALHSWFDAQVSDHGPDAMAGHMHHDGSMMK